MGPSGQQLGDILQQSMDHFMNSAQATQGTPASQQFLQNLRVIKGSDIVEQHDCQVCFEKFKDADDIHKLPCKHLYHASCITPWFQTHDTCPVCRMKMPS